MASIVHQHSIDIGDPSSSLTNVDKVVQSVTNATKRLSQISTTTNSSSKKRKAQNKIGPWKLGRTLGRGSTGRVRLAKNVHTGKLAAVKIVPKSNFKKLENPKYKNQDATKLPYGIEREIIIMKLIAHPNIMGLYDVWENKNDLYLILEYIEGGELFDYLIKRGKLLEYEAINYFKQIIHGIAYLHQFNICHRDLKPENLLLDFNKNIKIADFGMAALEVNEKLLETSCGSPHYASPEIVAGKNYHGAPSDIWSCGIILFALLTGHLPFDDENIRRLLLKVQNGKFIMPNELSWEAKDLISRMLKVNPGERIPIEAILKHPLLTKYPEPLNHSSNSQNDLILHSNIKPIQSMDKIDKEILRNLCILFHNCSEDYVVKCLLSQSKSPEKMFYYLLMKYRNEHSHTTGTSNYVDDDTDMTASESKQTLPRSTSIVKTTITTHTGEQVTTVKEIPRSVSTSSSVSLKRKVLANVTNTSFTASNPHKKKTLLNNTIISSASSSKSLKSQTKQRVLLVNNSQIHNLPLKTQESKPIQRKLTPGFINLSEFDAAEENKENDVHDHSIVQFQKICQDIFGSDVDTKSVYNMTMSLDKRSLSKETVQKLKVLNSCMSKASLVLPKLPMTPPDNLRNARSEKLKKMSRVEKTEQKLAEEVQRKNDARERAYKEDDERLAKLNEERSRQSRILQEKLREALQKINDIHATRNSSAPTPASQSSSLDPRPGINSLIRAKSLASRTPNLPTAVWNDKNSKVLQKLGIDVKPASSSASRSSSMVKTASFRNLSRTSSLVKTTSTRDLAHSSSFIKTSTSKNLSGLLNIQAENEFADPSIEDNGDNESIASFNDMESRISLKPTLKKEVTNASIAYRSLLNVIDEDKTISTKPSAKAGEAAKERSMAHDLTRLSVHSNSDLIPNPRFSRFSFNGLLTSKFENPDLTIMQNTLSSGTVVKHTSRKLLSTKQGGGLQKADTKDLPGLGISVEEKSQKRSVSKASTVDGGKNFISISSSDADFSTRCSSLQKNAISFQDHDMSSSTIAEDYNLSDNLVNMTQDYVDTGRQSITEQSSNARRSSSHLSGDEKKTSSSRKTSGKTTASKDTLVGNDKASINLMYKSYETLYSDKTIAGEERSSDRIRSTYERRMSSFNAGTSDANILDSSSLAEVSNYSQEMKDDFKFDIDGRKVSLSEFDEDDEEDDEDDEDDSLLARRRMDVTDDLGRDKPQRHGTLKSSMRRSATSTQIFSTMSVNDHLKMRRPEPSADVSIEKPGVAISSPSDNGQEQVSTEEPKVGLLRKMSLNPKRVAPKAPEIQVWDKDGEAKAHNRFSGISLYSSAKRFVTPWVGETASPKPSGAGWFKRFFQSLSKGKESPQEMSLEKRAINRDIHIIDTALQLVELMRIIKNQLKLKQIEGSVTNVDVDEEFALISGIVPTRFARGRKLHFKIEIIDLINSSSLHLLKIKGSRTGFKNLVGVVTFVVKQEEEATNNRKSKAYNFSGFRA